MREFEIVHPMGRMRADEDFTTQSEVLTSYCGATLGCFRAIFFAVSAEVLLVAVGILMWKVDMF
jgi:hypothetical protein